MTGPTRSLRVLLRLSRSGMPRIGPTLLLRILLAPWAVMADWPTLRGNPERTGYVDTTLPPGVGPVWAVELDGERLGTAMEPIVRGTRLFLATHSGRVWALDTTTGAALWRFETGVPILHSPSVQDDLVLVATAGGSILALHPHSGRLVWQHDGDPAGYAASPLGFEDQVLIGSRGGVFSALDLATGGLLWEREVRAPFRQSAAASGDRVWVTGEDMVTRCFARSNGRQLWASRPAPGQSARDYYPVVTRRNDRSFIAVRTSPWTRMSDRIERDRRVLLRSADPLLLNGDWRTVEAWTTNAASTATPEAARRERDAIREHLRSDPDARTFQLYDALSGRATDLVPVLWAGGCQGVATPPVALPDGRLFTLLRSAYGHWSYGVAPLVGVGRLDPASLTLELLNQTSGPKPPWNTFWGTADEALNLVHFRDAVVFVHQGTLGGWDPDSGRLRPMAGERDSFGGLPPASWAHNEWHGPARGGVAWSDDRLFWFTGSRVLCLSVHGTGRVPKLRTLSAAEVPLGGRSTPASPPTREELGKALARAVRDLLRDPAEPWAPLEWMPGLGGRSVHFERPADLAGPLARAWPHLSAELKERLSDWVGDLGRTNEPPFVFTDPVRRRVPRGYAPPPITPERQSPAGPDPIPLLFGQLASLIEGCRQLDPEALDVHWPDWLELWLAFDRSGWQLDPARGDLWANRILASLQTFADLAGEQGEPGVQAAAAARARELEETLVRWWNQAASNLRAAQVQGVAELDAFIGRGDGLFFRVAPHRHRPALFNDLTPRIARMLRERAPAAVDAVWHEWERLCPTWWLVGEERQVHGGENLLDPPDVTLAAFHAYAYLRLTPASELAARIDIPACRGDLYHIDKLAIALDAMAP